MMDAVLVIGLAANTIVTILLMFGYLELYGRLK
jgi:hypothetical protein